MQLALTLKIADMGVGDPPPNGGILALLTHLELQ
ncbi:hypothetical protein SXM_0307 [Shewanella xiamenensis]|nr:hypothetical protein SXM_0307 [Shewanella xiamenensis]